MKMTEMAPAKLNLTLEVGEKSSDGYHKVQSVMTCAALYDEITLESGTGGDITMTCDCSGLPCDETNLCLRAARLFFKKTGIACDGLHISLKKRIPMQAGLGGGSPGPAKALSPGDDDKRAGAHGYGVGQRCALLRSQRYHHGAGPGRAAFEAAKAAPMLVCYL